MNEDKSSQLGYFIFLSDKSKYCQPIFWSSYKSKRVTRSVLGSEVMAFADAFDMAYTIKYDLQIMLNKIIPISMLTDSKSLFDVLTSSSTTTEKRLMIDLQTVQDSYNKNEITDVAHIRSIYNISDALTKVKKESILLDTLRTSKLSHPVEQWIIRDNLNTVEQKEEVSTSKKEEGM